MYGGGSWHLFASLMRNAGIGCLPATWMPLFASLLPFQGSAASSLLMVPIVQALAGGHCCVILKLFPQNICQEPGTGCGRACIGVGGHALFLPASQNITSDRTSR